MQCYPEMQGLTGLPQHPENCVVFREAVSRPTYDGRPVNWLTKHTTVMKALALSLSRNKIEFKEPGKAANKDDWTTFVMTTRVRRGFVMFDLETTSLCL